MKERWENWLPRENLHMWKNPNPVPASYLGKVWRAPAKLQGCFLLLNIFLAYSLLEHLSGPNSKTWVTGCEYLLLIGTPWAPGNQRKNMGKKKQTLQKPWGRGRGEKHIQRNFHLLLSLSRNLIKHSVHFCAKQATPMSHLISIHIH